MGPPCSQRDRKSTRLNSSHHGISYAVFCLKKNKLTVVSLVPPRGALEGIKAFATPPPRPHFRSPRTADQHPTHAQLARCFAVFFLIAAQPPDPPPFPPPPAPPT